MDKIKEIFIKNNGPVKTAELKAAGISKLRIEKAIKQGIITRIKKGYYEYADEYMDDTAYIVKLFPDAIICMESALLIYQYTDRVPNSWRVAVDRDTGKTKFQIAYPKITPIYVSKSYLNIGIDEKEINGVKVKIYDRERTICDCLRYMNKMDAEIFRKAIKAYLKDKEQNIGKPVQYGKIFKITKKIDTYVGGWL